MDQGQQNGPRKVARPTFSCQDEGLCPSSGPDKKMWPWQLFLAHFVGPGPFLASGQLSLVAWAWPIIRIAPVRWHINVRFSGQVVNPPEADRVLVVHTYLLAPTDTVLRIY